jgi:hypothetical protein
VEPLKGKRRILWLGGLFALVLGILAGAAILPNLTSAPSNGASETKVPGMQNVPPEEAPKMQLEVEKK